MLTVLSQTNPGPPPEAGVFADADPFSVEELGAVGAGFGVAEEAGDGAEADFAVELAGAVQPLMQHTTKYPFASPAQVTFYAVTDAGVFTASASEDDLAGNRSPFSPLAAAAQNIVAEYRNLPPTR